MNHNKTVKSQDRPIRVLQFIGGLNPGGSQSMIMNIYRNIDRNKIQFDFVIDRKKYNMYVDEIESLGGKVYVFDEYFKGINYFRFAKQWEVFFREHPEYRIIHCHVRSVASIVLRIAKRFDLITICHSHNTSNGHGFKAVVKKVLQGGISKNCDYYFACSEESARWLYGERIAESERCFIINNAIDVAKYTFNSATRKQIRRELGVDSRIVIGQVGRFADVKNYGFSVNLLAELLKKDDRYYFIAVGTGPQKEAIVEQAKKMGVYGNMRILEKRNDVCDLLQAMDVFIMPSLYEGLPLALVEAQAASLPCVISDNIKDGILIDDFVEKIDLNNVNKWISRIIELGDGNKSRENVGKLIAEKGFDSNDVASKIERFYLDCCNNYADSVRGICF